jgi:hypothetical protein
MMDYMDYLYYELSLLVRFHYLKKKVASLLLGVNININASRWRDILVEYLRVLLSSGAANNILSNS